MGRPTKYTPQIVKEICDSLCEGIPLEEICRRDHMPGSSTIHSWVRGDEESVPSYVKDAIAHAREIGYDTIANGTRSIARGLEGSTGDVSRDKLIIETELKLLSKWMPKKYGERIQADISGEVNISLSGRLEAATKAIQGRVIDGVSRAVDGDVVERLADGSQEGQD